MWPFGASQAGTKASASTTVSSVQMLALQLHFGVTGEIKMLPSFLRCFPSVETLIVQVPSASFRSSALHCIRLLLHNQQNVQLKLFAELNCSLRTRLDPPPSSASSSGRAQVLLSVSSHSSRLCFSASYKGIVASSISSRSSQRMRRSWRGCTSG